MQTIEEIMITSARQKQSARIPSLKKLKSYIPGLTRTGSGSKFTNAALYKIINATDDYFYLDNSSQKKSRLIVKYNSVQILQIRGGGPTTTTCKKARTRTEPEDNRKKPDCNKRDHHRIRAQRNKQHT